GAGVDMANAAPFPDGTGRVVMGGSFQETATIGSTKLTTFGMRDAVVATLDGMGKPVGTRQIGNAMDQAILFVQAPAASPGNVVIAGVFQGTLTVGKSVLTSKGG